MIEQLIKAPPIGEARDRELLKDAQSYVYFHSPSGDLAAHFFFPPEHDPTAGQAPTILFLHGGLWDSSMPTQFVPHCLHFAARGAVTVSIEYRVQANHQGTPLDGLEDVAMALIFLRKNAAILGVDPERIVFAGAGSGAHLALCCATLPKIGSQDGDRYRPSALFLFSSLVNTTPKGVGAEHFSSPHEAKLYSPSEHVPQKELPPCLLFHGRLDRLSPLPLVTKFAKQYRKKKNHCELMEFEGAGHTFFNYNSHQQNYEVTLRSADYFLVEHGLLPPDPLADVM